MNIRSKNNKNSRFYISRIAQKILLFGFPIILVYLLAFLFTIISTPEIPGYVLARIYSYTLEHIVLSAVIILAGAILADISEKRSNSK